jgi:hypothetical protein
MNKELIKWSLFKEWHSLLLYFKNYLSIKKSFMWKLLIEKSNWLNFLQISICDYVWNMQVLNNPNSK